ncbi:probable ATP-dependent RNA helicase DDX20 isoform X2 [Patiria miniata]|nr:probable ATP-dependent RNA helicase DDX20 isoform X2 [Patiria miniata]
MIVQAKSGTGKTCVFSVIILESLDLQCSGVQALVLTPTREIATQVQGVIQSIGIAMQGLRCHTFIGGTLFGPDRQKLKKCHVAVGTPGRVKQLIEYDVMHTDSIRLFILDEADKLLEEKFQDQINWIYNRLPVNKQMLALSATYPEALAKGLTSYMRDPTFVRLNPRRVALKGIKQFYKVVPSHGLYHKAFEVKVEHLLQLLRQVSFSQCLVFSNLSSRAQNLSDILCERGWPSTCISGSQDQSQRHSAMSMLKTFKCRVLISTDLTARGIDAENVNLIINLDVPSDGKTYMHRIGRAGRFGSKGVAVTFASEGNEEALLRNIQRQSHVSLQHLPDPVPSDLVNLVNVDLNCSDSEEESSSLLDYDDSAQDNPDDDPEVYTQALREQRESSIRENIEVVEEQSSCKTIVDILQRTTRLRSNHVSQVNARGDSISHVLHPTVWDKSCQVDTLSLPFKMHKPTDFKIPSLAEKFNARRGEEMWTWEKAAKDFENFMNGSSEPVDVQPEDFRDAGKDENGAPQTSEETFCFAENDAAIYKLEDRQRTAPADEDTGSVAPEQPVNCIDGENLDEPDQIETDSLPRPEPENPISGISDTGRNTTDNSNDLSCKEEVKEVTASSDFNLTPERVTIKTSPVALSHEDQSREVTSKGKISTTDSNDTDKRERGSNLKLNTEYEVAFSWRPSQNFFNELLTDDMTRLEIPENRSNDDDDTVLESVNPDADTCATGVRSSDSLNDVRGDNAIKDIARSKELRKSSPARSKKVPQDEKRLSKATKAITESKQCGGATSSSEQQEYHQSGNDKPSAALQMHNSGRRNARKAAHDLRALEPRNSSTGLLRTNALVSNRQPQKEASRPGEDPIWLSYTNYLKTEDAQGDDDTDSCDESDDSDTGSTRTSDDQESSDDCIGDSVPGANQNSEEWNPDPETTAQHYGWVHSPYDPFAYGSWYGVPDYIPTTTTISPNPLNQDYPSQFGLSDYHKSAYSGQYTYWPYAYF